MRLRAPDSANYFEADYNTGGAWTFNELDLGTAHEYHATRNPNGTWTKGGSANWWDIEHIQFRANWAVNNNFIYIDGLWFFPERWSDTASNAASQTSYGQRDLEVTDDKLHSDGDCEKRAETLLYQLKDPPTQIDLTVVGNTNVLVGDRLSMTIPAEGISAANYDVISVEHSFTNNGFITGAVMVDSGDVRKPVANTPMDLLVDLRRRLKGLNIDERML